MTDAADPPDRSANPLLPAGSLPAGSNNGPPLDDDRRPWGSAGIGNYFEWAAAKKKAFDVPYDIAIMRARRAEALGLTYDEYTLEILERGRYLGRGDAERIAEIRRKRPLRD